MGKHILWGLLAMAVFFCVNWCVMIPLFSLIPGDGFTMSFHLYTYGGVTLLAGLLVVCTRTVCKKIDGLNKKIDDLKTEEE